MQHSKGMLLAWICVLIASDPGCRPKDKEREELREELDEEFERETEELVKEAERLKALLDKLVADHETLDKKHEVLDKVLKGKTLFPEHAAMQKKHMEWEEQHKQLMNQAMNLIQRFEKRKAEHIEMEEGHGSVPLDQVRKEHEEFERDLEAFKEEFAEKVKAMEKAEEQMGVIFEEHAMLSEKYGSIK